ncbi:hypothetical protein Sjap_014487 [Stephania japonica]|uniref:Pentatricopeptide repeat-containing protein n=1 Tax=Stephania japonica TaxID=461633 RepID=A0AAP0NRY3_9MAGN
MALVRSRAIGINRFFPLRIPNPTHTNRSIYIHLNQIHSDSSSNRRNDVVEKLVDAFTNQSSLLRNSEELRAIAPMLTPEMVETALKAMKSWRAAHGFFDWAKEQCGFKHNCYTYNAMASVLVRAKQAAQLRVLARDLAGSICPMSAGALGFFIRCLGSQGLVEEANWVFDEVKRLKLCFLNVYSYNCLLEAFAKSGRVELVEMRLREMVEIGIEPDKFTLTPVLQAYCNAGNFDQALSAYNQICDKGWIDEHVFTILAVSFSKWGEVDKAFELIERMEDHNMSLNEKTLCILIHGFAKESRIDKALQLFDKMRVLGFMADLALYSVLIEGLCKKRETVKALILFGEMKRDGIVPDVHIFTRLISLYSGEGDFFSANQLLEEGNECSDGDTAVSLYNAVLEGLVYHGSIDKAYLLLQDMVGSNATNEVVLGNLFKVKEGTRPNTTSFVILIDGLCKYGKLDVALSLFDEMIQKGYKGTVLLYNNLIHELCGLDRLEEAYELQREMRQAGHEPTQFTNNSIFGCLCKREDLSGAVVLLKEMHACGHEPWIKHSSMLVKQLCIHGKVLEACKFLTDMIRVGFLPDIIAYSAAIDGLFKNGEVDGAVELFLDILRRGYRPDIVAYNIIIRGLCKVGKVLEAQNLVNEMPEKGLLPSVVTYNLMIDAFCKTNEIDQAFCYFKRMFDEARDPTVITYTTLIDGLCSVGRPEDAVRLWDEMEDKGLIPNRISYVALIHGLCKCHRSDEALKYFQKMKEQEMEPDTFVYVALISNFVSNGELVIAFEILREMVLKWSFPGPLDKNHPVLMGALHKLFEDDITSSYVKSLIADGLLPAISNASDEMT